MCGFVAMMRFDGRPVDPALLARMRDSMFHRGPDDAAIWTEDTVGLGHRRLSIVDLSPAGRQPMTNEDGSLRLLFNGEIYNYVELTADLVARGHRFSSHTDGETILHLYEELGERCVERLNGMFAFVIWDRRTRTLFGARDRLGIKPFAYRMRPDGFVCASEIKAILADGDGRPPTPDYEGLADLTYCGYPMSGRTAFEGIRQLEPGQLLRVRDGRLAIRTYWDVKYDYRYDRSDATIESELGELLEDAVRIHCRSDAPLGCHLSGGLDSSTVVALAARARTSLPTFSIRFGGGSYYDETPYAKAVARHVGATYHEDVPGPEDFFANWSRLVWHNELPIPNSGGYSYFTGSRLAARHVKVSLTGHGGDEIFGGYPAQFRVAFGSDRMFGTPPAAADTPNGYATRMAGLRVRGVRGVVSALQRRMMPRRAPRIEDLWVSLHCGLLPSENPLFHPRLRGALRSYDVRAEYVRGFLSAPTDRPLDRCLHHDLRSYLPGLLHLEDRASMSVSLESRVPLLDFRIVEYLATLPAEQKVPGMVPKGLLRRIAAKWLPEQVRARREKVPFPVPTLDWLANAPAPLFAALLRSEQCLDRGVLNPDLVGRRGIDPRTAWAALNLELWFRIFVDGESPASLANAMMALAVRQVPRASARPGPVAQPATR